VSDWDRRRTPRQPADWVASYAVDGRPRAGWCDCRVVDLSLGGAGLELFGPVPRSGAGVRVKVAATSLGVPLPGWLRTIGPTSGTGTRVGIEWDDLTQPEHEVLMLLLAHHPVPAH